MISADAETASTDAIVIFRDAVDVSTDAEMVFATAVAAFPSRNMAMSSVFMAGLMTNDGIQREVAKKPRRKGSSVVESTLRLNAFAPWR